MAFAQSRLRKILPKVENAAIAPRPDLFPLEFSDSILGKTESSAKISCAGVERVASLAMRFTSSWGDIRRTHSVILAVDYSIGPWSLLLCLSGIKLDG